MEEVRGQSSLPLSRSVKARVFGSAGSAELGEQKRAKIEFKVTSSGLAIQVAAVQDSIL